MVTLFITETTLPNLSLAQAHRAVLAVLVLEAAVPPAAVLASGTQPVVRGRGDGDGLRRRPIGGRLVRPVRPECGEGGRAEVAAVAARAPQQQLLDPGLDLGRVLAATQHLGGNSRALQPLFATFPIGYSVKRTRFFPEVGS